MKKALVSIAYDKILIGDYLVPLDLTGIDFTQWCLRLLQQKNILPPGVPIKRVILKTGNSRRDILLSETLGEAGIKEGSLLSIL